MASAVAGEAAEKITGTAEVAVGQQFPDRTDLGMLASFAGAGEVNISLSERFNLEFEGRASTVGTTSPYAQAATVAHAFWRDPQTFAFGAFGGFASLEMAPQRGNMFLGGVEGQAYLGNLTLYAQAAAITASQNSPGSWLHFGGYFARGAARYFVTPMTRLQFDAQWTSFSNTDDWTNALILAGTVEHQFAATPFAGFANVRWDHLEHGGNRPLTATAVTFGIRAYFGAGSTLDNDRNGATMDVLPMPILLGLNFG
ncbi:MAG: hypothetical protein WDM94_13890 [Bauldia sp.]